MELTSTFILIGVITAVTAASLLFAPRAQTADGFFKGFSDTGTAPGLATLVLSQVTTWIFARSLMTAAVLGYYYGIAGAIAYAAYYLSFITGGLIIDRLRYRHGASNVQEFLTAKFGAMGTTFYNIVIILRLLSEVFANLIVVGLIFGINGSTEYSIAIILIAVVTFIYSMSGGLRASLRTDVIQASIVLCMIIALLVTMLGHADFSLHAIATSSTQITSPGWVLLLVALLQVWSYPLHDPVMMDRGFIADRQTTRRSFQHAAWISMLAIFAFALLGVFAGLHKTVDDTIVTTLNRLFSEPVMIVFNAALIISAISTLDSTFSSAAKLVAVDMNVIQPTPNNGRWVMLFFLLGGCAFLFLGSKDLFAAVAVSGTASMFLIPVVLFSIIGGYTVRNWALVVSFIGAISGAFLYMAETSGYIHWLQSATGLEHKYSWLLVICVAIFVISCASFTLAIDRKADKA